MRLKHGEFPDCQDCTAVGYGTSRLQLSSRTFCTKRSRNGAGSRWHNIAPAPCRPCQESLSLFSFLHLAVPGGQAGQPGAIMKEEHERSLAGENKAELEAEHQEQILPTSRTVCCLLCTLPQMNAQ